jgi:signal peptidase I
MKMDRTKRRIPIIAFLLSVVMPGLGHVYNGNLQKGILFFVGMWLLLLVLGLAGLALSFWGLICFVVATIVCYILVGTHAAIQAARLKSANLQWYNKWYIYVCILLLLPFALEQPILFVQYELFGARSFRVPASSMDPTLKKEDHFIAKLGIYGTSLAQRGDIVIFPYPEDRSKLFIKRIIGLPGERIQIKDKAVFVNDQRLEDPWGVYKTNVTIPNHDSPRDNFGPVDIPEGEVFVLGDNRDFSQDSRFWGNVKIKEIEGKALFIYWSDDWNRIGKQIR